MHCWSGRVANVPSLTQLGLPFRFPACKPFLVLMQAGTGKVGSALLVRIGAEITLGDDESGHERNLAWADMVATPALDAVEEAVPGKLIEIA